MSKDTKTPMFLHSDNYHMIQRIACYVRDINSFCIPLIKSLGFEDYTIKDVIRWCSAGGLKRLEKDYFKAVSATNVLLKKVAKSTFNDCLSSSPRFGEIANDWILNAHLEVNEEGRVMMSEENKLKLRSVYLREEKAIKFVTMLDEFCKQLNEFNEFYSDDIVRELLFLNDSGHYCVDRNVYGVCEDEQADEFIVSMLNPRYWATPDWKKRINNNYIMRHDEAVAKSKALFDLN